MAINFKQMKETLYSGVIADILDEYGYRNQVMTPNIRPLKEDDIVVGRAFTCTAIDVCEIPAQPYKLELETVDSLQENDVLVAATNNSFSGFWGELLTTVALKRGATGAVIDGLSRDTRKIRNMDFPLFLTGFCPLDSKGRTDMILNQTPILCGGVTVKPGDIIFGDYDGIVVIPSAIAEEVIEKSFEKVNSENVVRDAILGGMSATEVYEKYHIL